MQQIQKIAQDIQPLRAELTNHQLYHLLTEIDDVRLFMETHVYAVWDFMSLLKALQHHLTCITLPWKPGKNATTARFINEIVLGEESDVDQNGVTTSHFAMYLAAMREVGANTEKILQLIDQITDLASIDTALAAANLAAPERDFLRFTFDIIHTGQPHQIAAAFTFGREDLIPDMFLEIINQSNQDNHNAYPQLTYYLNRHIEIDGDEHGPLSLAMVSELCGHDAQKWEEVRAVAQAALRVRIGLWDGIAEKLKAHQQVAAYQ